MTPQHREDSLPHDKYLLRLFIAGATRRSSAAVDAVRKICDGRLKGACTLEIVDIYQHPELARSEQIIAVPTLVKKTPVPVRRFIGDMSRPERIISMLEG